MKIFSFIVLFVFILSGLAFPFDPEEAVQKGNSFYQKKQYEKAVESYQQVINAGFESDEVYFNMGNAYYKLGKLGYAILNYEKAYKLNPGDDDIQFNLRLASARTVDKIDELPKMFLVKWWESLVNLFSISGWTIVTFIFYLLLLGSIILYFFAHKPLYQKTALLSGMISAVFLILTVLFLYSKINNDTVVKYGVVVEQAVAVKNSPDENGGDAFIIHEGIKVNLEDQVADWVKIKLPDGKVGWLPGSNLKTI